ncbi:MAG: Ppx/GppA family phosphatase [Myxococcota bacterium]
MKAVIDIGTNSVLLLLAARESDGSLRIVRDEARVARLGEGVAQRGTLLPAAIERTVAILADYRALAEDAGAPIEAVATEGLRMASDRDVFLQRAKSTLGVPVRMISGEEEATLSYLSVAREHPDVAAMRVIDIGGASTELVAGSGEQVESVVSHKIGSVRLTEAHVKRDPITPEEIAAVEASARAALQAQPLSPADDLYGLAGTVTTAAALLLGLEHYDRDRVDGTSWTRAELSQLRTELAAEPLPVREARPCLPRGRADVVVAGLTILLVALEHCGAKRLVVRDRGLRYALV